MFIMTHDSIGLGEDGPTHQPVEHLASLRAMPNMHVIRPADANETVGGLARGHGAPRRPHAAGADPPEAADPRPRAAGPGRGARRGGYVLARRARRAAGRDPPGHGLRGVRSPWRRASSSPARDIDARVVSLPCWEIFREQPADYREQVLPPEVTARVAVEAAASVRLERVGRRRGRVHRAVDRFGASAPWKELYEHFGFTAGAVARGRAPCWRRDRAGVGRSRPRGLRYKEILAAAREAGHDGPGPGDGRAEGRSTTRISPRRWRGRVVAGRGGAWYAGLWQRGRGLHRREQVPGHPRR